MSLLGATFFLNFLNFIVILVLMVFLRNSQRPALLALIYSILIAVINFFVTPRLLQSILIFLVPDFILSFIVFKIMQKLQNSWLYWVVGVVGGLIMLYVAFFPVSYAINALFTLPNS